MKRRIYISLFVVCVTFGFNRLFAQIKPETMRQIQSLLDEKAARTPAQKKVGSQLLQAVRESHGQKLVPDVKLDAVKLPSDNGRVKVDINTTTLTDAFITKIQSLGGQVLYPSKQYSTVRALLPFDAVEKLAGDASVKSIETAATYLLSGTGESKQKSDKTSVNKLIAAHISDVTKNGTPSLVRRKLTIAERRANIKQQVEKYMMMLGAGVANSQGDRSHRTDDARNTYGYAGQGIKIGVLSDSYNALGAAATDVLNDDLPGIGNPFGNTTPVTVLADFATGGDEGRAMLQIVHDVVPKAQLFFATANISEASFAANIVALRTTYNCDIIIDDVFYFDEPAFQDGIVAQAVNTVTAAGAMYFSSAGNSGALALGTSGVWEGDFTDVGSPAFTPTGLAKVGTIHNFGSPLAGDSLLSVGSGAYSLQWSDPWGASSNDYDLFLVSATGVVKASSTTVQSGTQNPYEAFAPPTLVAGDRLIVFKTASAAVRAISLNTNRGTLRRATVGQTHGHACAADAFCVAATPATGVPFVSTNGVESFTSDGPRRIFFTPTGTPITPGNVLFSTNGGLVRNKPDVTAADGVSTTLPAGSGLNPFFGTSAAAPHAGAIAALLKSAGPALTNTQIRNILTSTALDILTPGYDIVSGFGILQAYQGIQSVNPTPLPYINVGTISVSEGSFSNGNGAVDPGEIGNLAVQLINTSLVTAPNVVVTVTTTTPGVTITKGTVNYGNIASGATVTNTGNLFNFAINSSVACGTVITFQVKVTFTGGVGTLGATTTYALGLNAVANISATLGSTPPTGPNFTSTSGQQIGRVTRTGIVSTCASAVANPGLTVLTGARQYDAYTFTNTTGADQCYTVNLAASNGINLFAVAYNKLGFVPSNPSLNYLAEPGSSSASQVFSFTVKKDSAFTVVVHDVNVVPASNSPYTLSITYTGCAVSPACTPIVITTATLPPGATGTYYVQHITATGGSGAYVDSLFGDLPAGLAFAGDSLYGTPTQAGTFPISIKVTDLAGCSPTTKTYTLVINGILPASVTATAGTPQSALINNVFTTALQATVKDASNNPLPGVNVIFTAPASGASGTFAGGLTTVTVVTNSSGVATAPAFTANGTQGSYNVTAHIAGVTIPDAVFALTNSCLATVVTSNADSGPGTLRYIVANACPNAVITFDPSVTLITLTSSEIPITKAVTINGPGANLLTISGNNAFRIFNISTGTAATSFSGMTLRNASVPATSANGGGAFLVNNGASVGAVTITNCVMTNNNLSLVANSLGGAVDNEGGTVTIDRCSMTNNVTTFRGAAVQNQGFGSMIISNSTISGNTAGTAGIGGGVRSFLPLTITNCTIFGNAASAGGNISIAGDTLNLGNTIVAGGILTVAGTGPDIGATIVRSADYNLIQTTTGITTLIGTTTHNITGVSPKLLPLANYGGAIPGLLPMSSSVVIDAGNPALLATATDQRGFPRKVGTSADIGAIETNYTATITSGTPQSTPVNMAFTLPLVVTVRESGNLIAGDSVIFTAPATGASGLFATSPVSRIAGVVTNASGVATSPTFTANNIVGTYNVTASIGSAFTPLNYALTNTSIPVAITNCSSTNIIVARPGFNVYKNEPVSFYTMDTITGAATLITGGPVKDNATGNNIDINGVGLNVKDGFLYGIRDTVNGTSITPIFYRVGTNYSAQKLFNIPVIPNLYVDQASGTFDDLDNFFFIAVTGTVTSGTTFLPNRYYLGRISNVSTLTTSAGTVSYTLIDFSGANCNGFNANISAQVTTSGSTAGTGIQDITYSNFHKSIFLYEAYQSPANSGNYVGQLFSINPSTGIATCYTSTTTFGTLSNEVAGISTTASGNLRIFTTNGDVYRTTLTSDFTSTLTRLGASGITPSLNSSIRGDLASCNVGPTSLPSGLPPSIVPGLPNQIVAYPNPARGITTIAVGQPLINANVKLLGSTGNIIAEKSGVSGSTFVMDLTGKPSGMYIVEVIQGSNVQQVRIVKD